MSEQEWLADAKDKIARAREHDLELTAAFGRLQSEGYINTGKTYDEATGETVYRVHFIKPFPRRITTILCDLIQNMRSALDLVVSELIRANGHTVGPGNGFVIARSEAEFEKAVPRKLKNVPSKAIRFFRRLKPYDGANSVLWQLAELDNMHKHDKLLPVVLGGANVSVKLRLPFLHGGFILQNQETGESIISDTLGPMTPQGLPDMKVLRDETVFYRSPMPPSVDEQVAFVMALAVNQNTRTGYLKVSDFLPAMLDHVERVIGIAERQLRP